MGCGPARTVRVNSPRKLPRMSVKRRVRYSDDFNSERRASAAASVSGRRQSPFQRRIVCYEYTCLLVQDGDEGLSRHRRSLLLILEPKRTPSFLLCSQRQRQSGNDVLLKQSQKADTKASKQFLFCSPDAVSRASPTNAEHSKPTRKQDVKSTECAWCRRKPVEETRRPEHVTPSIQWMFALGAFYTRRVYTPRIASPHAAPLTACGRVRIKRR